MTIPASVNWVTQYTVLFRIADLSTISRMVRNGICLLPYPSPFPHLLRTKRTWQIWSSNNNKDNWNTSKYFASLTDIMTDPLRSFCPHRTRFSSALLSFWKVLKILFLFPHLLLPSEIWVQERNMQSCPFWQISKFKLGWHFCFQRHFSSSTPCRLSLIYPITWVMSGMGGTAALFSLLPLHDSGAIPESKYCRAPWILIIVIKSWIFIARSRERTDEWVILHHQHKR